MLDLETLINIVERKSDSQLSNRTEIRSTVGNELVYNIKSFQYYEGVMFMIYVLSLDRQPLMPISRHGKVRRLLNSKKAKVIRREPFTIQLLFDVKDNFSYLTLKVDTGSAHVGTGVTDTNACVYYASEVEIRNDIHTKMEQRAAYRRARRNRKLRYRKARWLNRKNSIKKDRFSPTIVSKFNSHIREIELIKSILPISELVLETGTFDCNLLNHQDEAFNRHWGYQKGPNYGFKNAQEACFNRDDYKCQCCKTKKSILNAHHIIYRSKGGADMLDNLITLCEDCHKKLHRGELQEFESKLVGKKKGQLKHATQMNNIRIRLLKHYPDAIETFGFITKANREWLGLAKSHWMDAISMGLTQRPIFLIDRVYKKRHIAKGQYQLYQGQNSEKKLPRGKVQGFLNKDIIKYKNKLYLIKGLMSSGYCKLMNINGVEQKFENPKTVKLNSIKRVSARRTTRCISQKIIPSIA